jgi:hypothetical protein
VTRGAGEVTVVPRGTIKRMLPLSPTPAEKRAEASQLARDMLLCAMSTHGVMFAEQDTREFVRRARVFWSEVDSPTERPAEPKKPSDGDDDEPAEILVDDTIE